MSFRTKWSIVSDNGDDNFVHTVLYFHLTGEQKEESSIRIKLPIVFLTEEEDLYGGECHLFALLLRVLGECFIVYCYTLFVLLRWSVRLCRSFSFCKRCPLVFLFFLLFMSTSIAIDDLFGENIYRIVHWNGVGSCSFSVYGGTTCCCIGEISNSS